MLGQLKPHTGVLVFSTNPNVKPHSGELTVRYHATRPQVPVTGILAIELQEPCLATNTLTRLRHLIDHIISKQHSQP